MKDIGLGILDSYTVAIVLVTLVLAQVLFGYQIPLDATTPVQLFISLVIFTGYVYIMRSVIRVPVAVAKSWVILREKYPQVMDTFRKILQGYETFHFLLLWLIRVLLAIMLVSALFIVFLAHLINFAEKNFDENFPSEKIKTIRKSTRVESILGFLDRIAVLCIAICATIPAFQVYVQNIGIIGIFFMIGVFLLKGSFVALVEDGLVKAIEGKDEEKQEDEKEIPHQKDVDTTDETILRLGQVPIKIAHCEICGKICTSDGYGRIQKLCSLECRQKWFVGWDKDWCIGDGKQRQLLNSLRISGYSDYSETEKVINLLSKPITSEQAVWALVAIVRDSSRIFEYSYRDGIQESIREILKKNIQNTHYMSFILNACLPDENITVANLAAQVISTYVKPEQVSENYVGALLKSEDDELRITAIRILGRLEKTHQLVAHVEKTENYIVDNEN